MTNTKIKRFTRIEKEESTRGGRARKNSENARKDYDDYLKEVQDDSSFYFDLGEEEV